jgi:hypothetical protein
MSKRRVTVFDNRQTDEPAKVRRGKQHALRWFHIHVAWRANLIVVTIVHSLTPVTSCSLLHFQILNISAGISLAEFLKQASAKLNSFPATAPARRAFLQDGGVLDDADLIRDNDVVYLSAGEPFFRVAQQQGGRGAAAEASQS